ncbi:MAG TPA: hypothetical protein VF522_16735 [Ramlibacter sp.]|uniref:hypothetical protein n=1 Tax=Ramlibacter sp. TaxID=1917967 RepID=UPI002ECFDEE5
MELPVFNLGLVGFGVAEERQIRERAARYKQAHWRCGRAEGADAWLINGARVARMTDSRARIIGTDDTGSGAAQLLDVATRPTAVAMPAPQLLQQMVGISFDLRQPDTVAACLAALDGSLAPVRRLFGVAALLVKGSATVGNAVYELRAGAQLLAVADMKGRVYVSPDVGDEQLRRAAWKHRARNMVELPTDFAEHGLSELLWSYTTRTRLDLLPERYLECRIFLRRPPRVRPELLDDQHLRVIRELAVAPADFTELLDRIGMDPKTLRRALAALYRVGSITSNPDRVWTTSLEGTMWSTRAALLDDEGETNFSRPADGHPSTAPLA